MLTAHCSAQPERRMLDSELQEHIDILYSHPLKTYVRRVAAYVFLLHDAASI